MTTNNQAIANAAKTFLETCPRYVVCPENWKRMLAYLENSNLNPTAVASFQTAFDALNAEGKLKLKDLDPVPQPELTEADFERMSAEDFKRLVVIPEHEARQKKTPRKVDPLAKEFWDAHKDCAPNAYNAGILVDWLFERQLEPTLENLNTAFEQCEGRLEVSDAVLESLPADVYRKVVVEPEFQERQSKLPPPKPTERPFGVRSWSEWIHLR
jgi:hypothetical protein